MESKSIIDKINEAKEQRQKEQNEKFENLKMSSKEIFNSANGKYFLKFLKEICLWNQFEENIDKDLLAYREGRKQIWGIVRTVLPKEILAEIEIYND